MREHFKRSNHMTHDRLKKPSDSKLNAAQGQIPIGELASSAAGVRFTPLGVATTGELTRDDRDRLREQGLSTMPIGWGVVISRKEIV